MNVGVTAGLLDHAAGLGARRVVYISSTSVYGHALVPTDRAVWVDEQLTPLPRDNYDETKLAAEELVAVCAVSSVTLRISRCFPEPLPARACHLLHRAVDVSQDSSIPAPQALASRLTPSHRAPPTWGNGLCASQEQAGSSGHRSVPCRARRSPDRA